MKKIVRKSHEKEIAYELSKNVTQTKLGGGGYFSPPGPDRVKQGTEIDHEVLLLLVIQLLNRYLNLLLCLKQGCYDMDVLIDYLFTLF